MSLTATQVLLAECHLSKKDHEVRRAEPYRPRVGVGPSAVAPATLGLD